MSQRWPLLDVYGVADEEELVTKCLGTIENLKLIEQFMARKVVKIWARRLLVRGRLGTLSEGGFMILLDSETVDNEIHYRTIGHKLGHTFEFDLSTWKRHVPASGSQWLAESERFAEAFGERWLASRDRFELCAFLNYCLLKCDSKDSQPVSLCA